MRPDVIVAGGGIAGLGAAIEAAEAGASVLVVESCAEPGGAAALSGGGTFVADSSLQQALGIEDSPELALSDWLSWGGEEADAAWAERYTRRSREDVFDWLAGHGVAWTHVHLHEGNSVPRWHAPRGGGAEVVRLLVAAAKERGVRWRLAERVTAVLREGDEVAGAAIGGEELRADAVLVATGGFTGSARLVARFGPDVGDGSRVLLGGAPSAQGDGLALFEDAGAQFTGLDRCWVYPYGTPDDLDPEGRRGMAARGVRNEIWVNAGGRRFHDEDARGGATGTAALCAQRPATCWSLFDDEEAALLTLTHPRYGSDEQPDRLAIEAFLERSPYAHRGDTVADVARSAGLPGRQVTATVGEYNDAFASNPPRDAFGRDLGPLRPIDRPPYVALQYFPMARKCLGGVRTDLSCRVVGASGSPIAGLFAAGEVAGMAGGHINGRAALEGTMFGPSLFSGRIAGRAMADQIRPTS
jgi:predicted oxidoreductase